MIVGYVVLLGGLGLAQPVQAKANASLGQVFVSKPFERLTPDERALNAAYVDAEVHRQGRPRLDVLIGFLTDGKHLYLARPGLVAVGWEAVPRLRELVGDRGYGAWARVEVLKTLDEIGDLEAADYAKPALKPVPIDIVARDTYKGEPELQWLYLDIKLRGMTADQRIDVLFDMLLDDQTGLLASIALERLGPPVVPRLAEVLNDRSMPYRARFGALQSLWKIGDTRCVPAFVRVLRGEDETDQIRTAAAAFLGQLGDPSAIPALEEVAASWKPKPGTDTAVYNVRRSALKSVEQLRR